MSFSLAYLMNFSFVLLFIASVILRYVATQARAAFTDRLTKLLPRKVMEDHLDALFAEYRPRLGDFRWQALPFSALQAFLNTAACVVFIAALWACPAQPLSAMNLLLLRYGCSAVVIAVLAGDLIDFGQLCYFTYLAGIDEVEETGEA